MGAVGVSRGLRGVGKGAEGDLMGAEKVSMRVGGGGSVGASTGVCGCWGFSGGPRRSRKDSLGAWMGLRGLLGVSDGSQMGVFGGLYGLGEVNGFWDRISWMLRGFLGDLWVLGGGPLFLGSVGEWG